MKNVLRSARFALLGAAVALAFADSSIVVLALPALLGKFDASIQGIAWVITSYNVVVAVVAVALVRSKRRFDPVRLTRHGLIVFAAASLACAFSPSLWALVAFRSIQGLGGAMLLAGSLPLARSLAGDPERGAARWAVAGALGAALGPAVGGALTEAFDWRAIFLVQAPIAALAVVAALGRVAPVPAPAPAAGRTRSLGANAALALLSGALVGALFLVVVVLIEVWGYSPLRAAVVVSALPAGTLLARLVRGGSTAAGSLLLAGGLAALAFTPGPSELWFAAALGLCGLGLGLAVPSLTGAAGDWSVAARHIGLVAALLALTPLLAHDVSKASTQAERVGTAAVLDAPIDTSAKVPLAVELATGIARAPTGSPPDLESVFTRHSSTPGVRQLEHSLEGSIRPIAAHAFRRSFLLSALFALVVAVPLALRPRRALVPAAAAAAALLVAEMGAGGYSYGSVAERNPCHPPATVSGSSFDRIAQRVVLRGVDELACQTHTTREQLVLDLADKGDRAKRWVEGFLG
jgi:predicted MFS family arabinose efflux permease